MSLVVEGGFVTHEINKVSWFVKFPSHWNLVPAKRLFPESKERAQESDEQLSATQEYGVIPQSEFMRLAGRRVVQLLSNIELRKRVEVDDFVISMRSFQGGLERAWACGGIRSSYVVLRPVASVFVGYYQFLFKSDVYIQALQSTANFIRDGQDMNYQNFVLIDLPYPPYEEQRQIAAFLQYEITKIDALVAEQEKLIVLLKEKRQAVISHAVTKGLNPDAPMKDSGVEWLGQVPEHWDVNRIKFVTQVFEQGWSPQCESEPVESDEEFGVLKVGCVNGGIFRSEENKKLPSELEPIKALSLKADDLLISRANTRELVGSAAVVPVNFDNLLLCDKLYRLRLFKNIVVPQFLSFFLSTDLVRTRIETEATGASQSMLNISQSTINNLYFPCPSIEEQLRIVEYVVKQQWQILQLVADARALTNLLNERRSALISAAVTGKIDVRGWQPPAVQ